MIPERSRSSGGRPDLKLLSSYWTLATRVKQTRSARLAALGPQDPRDRTAALRTRRGWEFGSRGSLI